MSLSAWDFLVSCFFIFAKNEGVVPMGVHILAGAMCFSRSIALSQPSPLAKCNGAAYGLLAEL